MKSILKPVIPARGQGINFLTNCYIFDYLKEPFFRFDECCNELTNEKGVHLN